MRISMIIVIFGKSAVFQRHRNFCDFRRFRSSGLQATPGGRVCQVRGCRSHQTKAEDLSNNLSTHPKAISNDSRTGKWGFTRSCYFWEIGGPDVAIPKLYKLTKICFFSKFQKKVRNDRKMMPSPLKWPLGLPFSFAIRIRLFAHIFYDII